MIGILLKKKKKKTIIFVYIKKIIVLVLKKEAYRYIWGVNFVHHNLGISKIKKKKLTWGFPSF